MNPLSFFAREAAPGLGVGAGSSGGVANNPTVVDSTVDLVQAPTTLYLAIVFGLLTLIGLKFLFTRKYKTPVALVILALVVGTLTAFLSSADGPVGMRSSIQGYRTFIDGFVFGLAMLVGILHLGLVLFPGIRNVSPPKGGAIAAAMFFVIFGLSSIPEISQSATVRAILISLAGTLGLAAAILVNTYVTDGLAKFGKKQPGGVKLLSLAAWFWLFYPLTGIVSVFLLSDNASLFVYDIVHLLAVTLSVVAIYLLNPLSESEVVATVEVTSAPPVESPVPQSTKTAQASSSPSVADPSAATSVVRKPEAPKTVIGRPARPPKPNPTAGAGEGKDIPKAPPPPKPKRRY